MIPVVTITVIKTIWAVKSAAMHKAFTAVAKRETQVQATLALTAEMEIFRVPAWLKVKHI